jgi:antitoxin ParD1/3/4
MRSERVTVTMPAEEATQLRRAVEAGGAESVSAYVAEAVRERLARDRAVGKLVQVTGGPPSDDAALTWARRALGVDESRINGGATAS